jgi:hypothetical protein
MTKNNDMKLIKGINEKNLDNYFGKTKETKSESDIWRVSLLLSKEDERAINEGFEALPRKYKAIRDYFREGMLEIAKRDKEKGDKIKELMKDLDK